MGDEEETGAARSGRRLMLFAILSLIIVVILMVVLHLYTRLRLSHRMRRRDDRRIRQQIVAVESLNFTLVEEPPKRGLDPSVVASLPTFSYKLDSASDSEPIECSVCLGSVVEGSTVKELPNCKHLFHVECIDLWLGGSTNCPNCRAV